MRLALVYALALAHVDAHADVAAPADEARALLDRWVTAQNKGDFAAYSSLYSATFRGVRRSGDRAVELDHDGWLRDRARMFKQPMRVTVAGASFTVAADGAEARFTQRFEQGTYRDLGPKRMLLAREAGALRIVREEMLASTVIGIRGERFAPVIEQEIVLHAAPPRAWGRGPVETVRQGGFSEPPMCGEQAVDAKALPREIAARVGARVRLTDGERTLCEATIGQPRMIYLAGGDCADHPPEDDVDLARDGQRLLVAPLDGPCVESGWANWALPAERAAPVFTAPEKAPELLPSLRAALSAVAGAPRWSFRERARIAGALGDRSPRAPLRFRLRERGRPLTLVVWPSVGLTTVWEVADGAPTLRALVDDYTAISPRATDLDGDGLADFVEGGFAVVRAGDGFERVELASPPHLLRWACPDCGTDE